MNDVTPGTFLYFAYGSNMFTRRLTARTPSATASGTGFVEGHRLTFDKVSDDGSGKCDIEATTNRDDRVYGVIFRIATAQEPELDRFEALGRGYRKDRVQVLTPHGPKNATTYIATNKEAGRLPYHWYKAFVIAGAVEHGLPNAYIERLRTVGSQPDSDANRRARNEAVLSGS